MVGHSPRPDLEDLLGRDPRLRRAAARPRPRESGWLQNANDPPWTTTFPLAFDPRHFPPYMAPRGMGFRPQRSARMLAEDASFTWEDLLASKHSTRMELADRLLDDLAAAVKAHGDPAARRGLEVLEKWDRTADNGSRGGVLFAQWTSLPRT